MVKKLTLVSTILVLLVLVGFYLVYKSLVTAEVDKQVTVRLGWVHQAQFAGFYVAKEKGFYDNVGLNVELLESDQDLRQTAEIAAGDVDVSVMEAHQLLGDQENLDSLKAVAAVYQVNPHVLAVRADSGINGPEDFNGKILGLAGGKSEGNALFETFVDALEGVMEVQYKELGFDTIEDFINNEADVIDVYRIDQPYLAQQKGVDLKIIPLDAYGFATYGDVIVFNKEKINNDPDLVRAFVQATMKGWQYAVDNPDEAVTITLQYTEGVYDNRAYQEHIMYESIPLVRGNVLRLGEMTLVPWSTLYESMRRIGVVSGDFEVSEVFTNEFIQ